MENIDLEIVQSLVEYCYTGILSKQGFVYMFIARNKYSHL